MQETGGDVGAGILAGGAESQGRRGFGGGRGSPGSAGAASAADHGAPGVAPAQHSSQKPGSRPCVLYPTRGAVRIGLGDACGGRWDKRTGGSGAAGGWNGQGAWGG